MKVDTCRPGDSANLTVRQACARTGARTGATDGCEDGRKDHRGWALSKFFKSAGQRAAPRMGRPAGPYEESGLAGIGPDKLSIKTTSFSHTL